MRLQGNDALLGLVYRYRRALKYLGIIRWLNSFYLDAANFEASPFFGNTSSDVGGWGDPNNDGQIYTGGFKDEIRAYPTPHHIRRNYTLYPFQNPLIVGAASSGAPPPPTNLMINTTMTKTNVDYSVNNFPGDYIGFQGYMESVNVSLVLPLCLLIVLTLSYRVLILVPILSLLGKFFKVYVDIWG